MADKMTPEQRRHCMSRIGSRNTRPEMIVRRWLWRNGFRYRVGVRQLPGTPDIVLRRYSTVIFVNGCFWHGHDCDKFRMPATHTEFWRAKFSRNKARDERVHQELHDMGYYVLVVWECQLSPHRRRETLLALSARLASIYLDTHQAKPRRYDEIEMPLPLLAAESCEVKYTE
ncbi:MAG: DNA mismatch endonuclease Vsr [Muribaculaceae bacterium]|nr:DNA mismatch endonuclease Vsr [Muribaculaceae bacterium]